MLIHLTIVSAMEEDLIFNICIIHILPAVPEINVFFFLFIYLFFVFLFIYFLGYYTSNCCYTYSQVLIPIYSSN